MPVERRQLRTRRWASRFFFSALLAGGALSASPGRVALAADDWAARRAEVAGMQPAEQQELLRKQERFASLSVEEQDRLRALQATIDADPNGKRLHELLVRYHEWLKTLSPSQREELSELPPKERIQLIKQIQRQQQARQNQARAAQLLSKQDMLEIVRWTEDFAWKNRDRLLEHMPDKQRKNFDKADRSGQRRMLLFRALTAERARRSGGGPAVFTIEQADIDQLAAKLSEPARQELAGAGDLPAQRRTVGGWIGMAVHRLELGRAGRRLGSLASEDLLQFLQNEVPIAERDRLLKMPREQMLEELRGMYFQRGRGDGDPLPGGPGFPRFDGKSPDRWKGGPRGRTGRPLERAEAPPQNQSEDAAQP
jgi:hypothetical protein